MCPLLVHYVSTSGVVSGGVPGIHHIPLDVVEGIYWPRDMDTLPGGVLEEGSQEGSPEGPQGYQDGYQKGSSRPVPTSTSLFIY